MSTYFWSSNLVLRRLIEFTQYLAIRYSERLAENDIVASVGWRGDSYDNAMAESVNGLYKWELFYPRGPWRSLDDVEFATLGHVDWFNHRRLHGETTDAAAYVTPAEFEADYYRQRTPALVEVSQTGEQPCNPGWFKMSSSLDSGHLGNRR